MKIRMIIGCVIAYATFTTASVVNAAERVYLEPDEFITQAFPDGVPRAQALWVPAPLRQELRQEFGWQPGMRVRFWQDHERTAWILDEIGKDKPITAGVVVSAAGIEKVEVLVFRESRGWEIKFPQFRAQFVNARLDGDRRLNQRIDGITGATLSVKAMKRMARVALRLHDQVPARTLARAD